MLPQTNGHAKRKAEKRQKRNNESSKEHAKAGKMAAPQDLVVKEAQPSVITKRDNEENVLSKQQKVVKVMPAPLLVGLEQKTRKQTKKLGKQNR